MLYCWLKSALFYKNEDQNSLHVGVLKIENKPKNNNIFGNRKTFICTLI